MRQRSSETDRGGGAGSREGSGSGGSDAAEGGNLGVEKPAQSGVEEEEVLLSGNGGDAGVALRSEEELESKLRARGGRQVMRRSSMVAKQVISIESALGLGFVSQLWVDTLLVTLNGEEFSMADRLSKTAYIAGEEFSMADVMFIPVLARLALLNLEDEYINSRPNMAKYWSLVQQRPSYKKVIGRYFGGWRKYRTLAKTWCFIRLRNTLKKY